MRTLTTERQEELGLDAFIRDRTVCLVDMTDKTNGGSAVKIAIGDRKFLATASHVLRAGHDIRALVRDGGDNAFVADFRRDNSYS